MSSTRDFKAPAILAEEAETTIPTTPVSGLSYRNVDTSDAVIQKGFRFNAIVDSASLMNQFQYMLSRMMKTVEQQGILGWCDLVDYGVNAMVMGSNGILYRAIRASGPNSGGAKDPITQVTTWEIYGKPKYPEVPVGTVIALATPTTPRGWRACFGNAVLRKQYPDLFAAIGTTYGEGDGSTTFNLPDLRGEFIRGWCENRNVDAGRVFGSNQGDDFKAHTHTIKEGSSYPGPSSRTLTSGDDYTSLKAFSQTSSSTGGNETRPRNIALKYCIKVNH